MPLLRTHSRWLQKLPLVGPRVVPRPFFMDLNTPILRLSNKGDVLSLGMSFEAIFATGQTGGGKSSGPAAYLARALLNTGAGMLVLAAKPGEADLWRRYCAECGRIDDLVVFDGRPDGHRFNFLDYEFRRGGVGSGEAMNITELLMRIAEATQRYRKGASSSDPFWPTEGRKLTSHTVDALTSAHGRINVSDIVRFIQDAPTKENSLDDTAWREKSFCYQTITKMLCDPARPLSQHDRQVVADFFGKDFRMLADRTRSGITAEVNGMLTPLLKGTPHTLFSTVSTLCPEACLEGAILVIDMPVKVWNEVGVLAATIFKALFQRMAERRDVRLNPRPLALFMDECQFFISDADNEFQSTARSSRVATVALTQNLPTIMEHIGGRHPEHAAKQWLGNFATKIMCANGCEVTNNWASQLIGRGRVQMQGSSEGIGTTRSRNHSIQYGGSYSERGGPTSSSGSGRGSSSGHSFNRSRSVSETMDQLVQSGDFGRLLRTGGPANGRCVDTVIYRAGHQFRSTGTNWMLCTFRQ